MTDREIEINAILRMIDVMLERANLTLSTREGVPVIIKDEKTGKLYGIVKEGGQHE